MMLPRSYLDSARPTFRTDHNSSEKVQNSTDASGTLPRWRSNLSEFEFHIDYRPGVVYQAADELYNLRTNGLRILK